MNFNFPQGHPTLIAELKETVYLFSLVKVFFINIW